MQIPPPLFTPLASRSLVLLLCILASSLTVSAATLQTLDGKTFEGDLRLDNGQIIVTPRHAPSARLNLEEVFQASFKTVEPPKPAGTSGPIDKGWSTQDVGPTGTPGDARMVDGKFAVKGAGADIKGTIDSFYYVYQELRGDGQIIARVSDLQGANPNARVGLMIRESYNERGSRTAFLFTEPAGNVGFATRLQTDGEMAFSPASLTEKAPVWLRLARIRNLLSAYKSADGISWTPIGQPMEFQQGKRDQRRAFIGLAVCSRDANALCGATFDNVGVHPAWAGDDGNVKWSGAEVVRTSGPILTRGIVFRGGSVVGSMHVHAADEKSLRVNDAKGKPMPIATSEVSRLIVGPVSPLQLAKIPPGGVGVLLAKGDFMEGEFAALHDGRVRINSVVFGPKELAAGAEVLVIALHDRAMSQAPWVVRTNEGFVYMARSLKVDRDQLLVEDEAVGAVKVAGTSLAEIRVGGGRVDSLVDLKPARIEAPPGVAAAAAYSAGPADPAPKLSGMQSCERGILSRAGTSLHYDLDGKYQHFLCQPGLLEGMLPSVPMQFVVLVDGKEVYRSAAQTSLDDRASISLNVAGAKVLTLRVECAGNVNLPALAAWGDPTVVR